MIISFSNLRRIRVGIRGNRSRERKVNAPGYRPISIGIRD
jgi:hypothetical protein